MSHECLCEACRRPSNTQLCLACYSTEHRTILSTCQIHLQRFDAQKLQLQFSRDASAKKFVVRNKLLTKGIQMAIEEEDEEHWDILLDRRERVSRMWEEEKRDLEKKEKELDKRSEMYVERAEKEVRSIREAVGLADIEG